MNCIEVNNLSKFFGKRCIFYKKHFAFEKGKIHCIMGESGVGKTTLLRIMLGLEKADEGEVVGAGHGVAVFQENRLIDDISAIDNIKLVCGNCPRDNIEGELSKLLPKECLSRKVSELSGGMQRRVAIVRAMMSECDTIFLDEPFIGLDEENKANVYEYIKNNQKGRTIFLVTHNKEEANALIAKIYLLTSEDAVATIMGDCE